MRLNPPGYDRSKEPPSWLIILFGFSPSDDKAKKLRRMKHLFHMLQFVYLAPATIVISWPERDRQDFRHFWDSVVPKADQHMWASRFHGHERPNFTKLSEDRSYLEKRYTQPGHLIAIFDADLKHVRNLGLTGAVSRTQCRDPRDFAAMFQQVRKAVALYPEYTIWMFQDRNTPSEDAKRDRQYEPLREFGGNNPVPKTRSHIFFFNAKAPGAYAPQGQAWSKCEDVYRLLAEKEAGGKFGVSCWQQTWIQFEVSGNYKQDPEWNCNREYLHSRYGLSLKDRSRTYESNESDDVDPVCSI